MAAASSRDNRPLGWAVCADSANPNALYRTRQQGYANAMSNPEILFRGRRFCVERVVQTMPDATRHIREVVRHPGAVVILPLLDDGRVCFVRNYRVAVAETLIELPAGTLEPDEDPAETAIRELAEETGYRADRLDHLITFCMSPGILDEQMHLYLAQSLRPGAMALEAGEDLEPLLCTWEEALEMVRRGEIRDAKTLVGLLYYRSFR
jgi:ADP-ribose pyrophosphatase